MKKYYFIFMIIISFSNCVIIAYWFKTYTRNDNWNIFSFSFIFIMGIVNLISYSRKLFKLKLELKNQKGKKLPKH